MKKRYTMNFEIDQCFKENPDLMDKTMKELAVFFFIQGKLSNSHVMQANQSMARHYLRYLRILDEQTALRAIQEWKEGMYEKE